MTKLSSARMIPLMVLFIGTVSGCATYEKCGIEGCPGDQKTTAKVEAVFRQHPELGTRVGVQTSDHVVYLSGIVSDPSVVATAASLAEQVNGVSRVENTIVVSQ
jgi:osmotically-inducible protein OsmY